ncbi:hypothetical protein N0V93_003872 [Gnomoniopsis smithogilvyi]|uniref:Nucleoporin Nup159/Nup146 N-terminal domain-containing protein n=1 Tax=Gnomoniopsis smithogilvyi TaxID=1191159 RepID=A0A9W8Z021_9PEZI|nr:hypothetical protein N0V93_003872 [Gnomoniopsis smithogilvyi]
MDGPDLELIQTERLGFLPVAKDAKVQLTPKWSPPPAPTASLLAIASRKAIVAAAGPDTIYVSPTDAVRKAFEAPKDGESEIRAFEGHVKIPMPMRISHLAFTPDEKYLIMSAEQGGGLAVYETQTILQGSAQSVFEIGTSGEIVKTLVPNPMPELAEFCAVVTTNGNLLMANFKEESLAAGSNGPVLRSGVTSVGWSTKGKQLVAGLADGTIIQMTPDGTEKAVIPKPESLVGDFPVASVSWLENHLFLAIYNDAGDPSHSEYFAITRSAPAGKTPSFETRRLVDPVQPFGNESAPHHTILRLRDYPPAIQELLIVSSSVSDGLGLLTKAKASLSSDPKIPAEQVTNVFTTTEFSDDSRRAQLPTDEEFNDTTPIGVALDLSSKDKVYKPDPADEEIEFSPGPLPGAWALNNNGVLGAWWMIYYDAVREGKTYPGMAVLQAEPAAQSTPSALPKSSLPTPAFGSQPKASPFGSSAFNKPAPAQSNPFGGSFTAATGSAFGAPAFGAPSALGGAKPPAPAFGQSGGLGNKASPWATGSAGAAPAFGSHGFSSSAAPVAGSSTGGKVFGSGAATAGSTTGGGFAGLAGQSGFAGLAGNQSGGSVFSKPASPSPFGGATAGQSAFGGGGASAFGTPSGSGAFGSQPNASNTGSVFGGAAKKDSTFGSSPFVLGTTFKQDPITANDNEKPSGKGGLSLGGFGLSLDDAASKPAESTESKDENMGAETPVEQEKPKSIFDPPQGSTTPTSTPAPPKFNPFDKAATAVTTGRSQSPKANPFASVDNKAKSSASPFGSLFGGSSDKPNPFKPAAADAPADPPLPPDATNLKKPSEPVEDAPLPPDFVAPKSKKSEGEVVPPSLPKEDSPVPEEAPLPPDFTKPKADTKSSLFNPPAAPSVPESSGDDLSEAPDSDDDGDDEDEEEDDGGEEVEEGGSDEEEPEVESEGSGVDVAKDLSPSSVGASHTPGQTPHSSFGGFGGSTFSLVPRPDVAQPSRSSVFGGQAPILPKPALTSPRSPSPIRTALPPRMLPGEGSRSVSAPSGPPRPRSSGYSKSVSSRVPAKEDPNVALQREAQKKQAEKEEQSLEDEEYERVQALLESPVEPALEIGEFTAFNTTTADSHASTVAAQVEALYRDMNGMLVTLGMNARVLASFITGHEQRQSNEFKTKEDLDNSDDWVLCEAEDLNHILDDELAPELADARVQDVQDTWDTCQDLVRELPKLRAKKHDLKRILDTVLDPDQGDAVRQTPLSTEQAAQQNALRQGYARVSKLMADAESALTMLKTKLASASGKPSAQPTVDAIIRTIAKMTSAAEKRSGEIDILESQMRKLRVTGSLAPSACREGTPETFRTPPSNKRLSLTRTGSGTGHSPSPRRSLNGSVSRGEPSPRKKVSGYTLEEKDAIREKMQKRQAVLDRLRVKLVENGPKVSRMGDTR